MNEIVKMISETGVLLVIAAVFLWDKITNAKTTEKLLQEIKAATMMQDSTLKSLTTAVDNSRVAMDNTTTALNMIEMTQKGLVDDMARHDKRSEYMNTDVKKILEHTRNHSEKT